MTNKHTPPLCGYCSKPLTVLKFAPHKCKKEDHRSHVQKPYETKEKELDVVSVLCS